MSQEAQQLAILVTLYHTDYESDISRVPPKARLVVRELSSHLFGSGRYLQYMGALVSSEQDTSSAEQESYKIDPMLAEMLDPGYVRTVFGEQIASARKLAAAKFGAPGKRT